MDSETATARRTAASDYGRFMARYMGRYEVLLPDTDLIHFASTLEQAAQLLSEASNKRYAVADVLQQLQASEQRGQLGPGGRGQLFYRPGGRPDGSSWIARVRGGRNRQAPRFEVGQVVYANPEVGGLPANIRTHWNGKVASIEVTNHPAAERTYRYNIGPYSIRENRLRPASEAIAALDAAEFGHYDQDEQ